MIDASEMAVCLAECENVLLWAEDVDGADQAREAWRDLHRQPAEAARCTQRITAGVAMLLAGA